MEKLYYDEPNLSRGFKGVDYDIVYRVEDEEIEAET
jgi:hypothetical protein